MRGGVDASCYLVSAVSGRPSLHPSTIIISPPARHETAGGPFLSRSISIFPRQIAPAHARDGAEPRRSGRWRHLLNRLSRAVALTDPRGAALRVARCGKGIYKCGFTAFVHPLPSCRGHPWPRSAAPPGGRGRCASSVAAPLPCPLGCSDSRLRQGKGRWSRASIDPYPSLVFRLSAASIPQSANEGGVDPLARNYSSPVVADCYIDTPTRPERAIPALRRRLRRRSRVAARPSVHAGTRAPSVCSRARAC